MFEESLTKGSGQAQVALQRLTTFLETEGAKDRISPALQKKVLGNYCKPNRNFTQNANLNDKRSPPDVLLAALSDCLTEHPGLIPAAKASLGSAIDRLPKIPGKQ